MNFNLRRDHRSLATRYGRSSCRDGSGFQSQARPPLPCHSNEWTRNGGAQQVSISGETTAPLPQAFYIKQHEEYMSFNLRRDHRSLATMTSKAEPVEITSFKLRRGHRSLATNLCPSL